jgi:hypothetical protein
MILDDRGVVRSYPLKVGESPEDFAAAVVDHDRACLGMGKF